VKNWPYILLAFAFLVPLGAAVLMLRRSATPHRRRQQMLRIALPLFAFVGGALVLNSLRAGEHSGLRQVMTLVCFATVIGCVWWELRKLAPLVAAEQPRPTASPLRLPPMLWPFAIVLLPLLLLAALAGWTLVLDQRSAQEEAKALAEEVAARVLTSAESVLRVVEFEGSGFRATSHCDLLILNEQFALSSPSPRAWPPVPAPLTDKDFGDLKKGKLEQWHAAEAAFARHDWTNAATLYLDFLQGRRRLGTEPMADFHAGIASSRFRPLALFRRAQVIEALGAPAPATAAYNDLIGDFVIGRDAPTESGLSLSALAAVKILDLVGDRFADLPEEWRTRPTQLVGLMVNLPASPLTADCLHRLKDFGPQLADSGGNKWQEEMIFHAWTQAERGRQRYAEASDSMGTNAWPEVFWVNAPERWLAVRQKPPPGWPVLAPGVHMRTEFIYAALPADRLRASMLDHGPRLWERFVMLAEVCGQTLSWPPSPGPQDVSPGALAQSVRSRDFPVTVSVGLRDANAYFRSVARRQALFVALIVGALAAGAAAAWALRRSLLRQLALNQQKSNFVSSVSHELRAPVASVRLMAESLERGRVPDPARQHEYFRLIGQETRRLTALIENVLDFARIEQGRKQYEFEPTDLRRLVAETVKLMEPYAAEKGVELKSEIRNPKSEVEADGRALQQALVNLLDNAIKHSPAGETVTVAMACVPRRTGVAPVSDFQESQQGTNEKSETAATAVLLSVSDHGPGIPASEHDRIFERFYRLGSELRRETQGVGIGLSIVKHIVAAHGGRVRVESEAGKGSCFTIELSAGADKSEVRNPKSE
jgi:signal transduction histidine kinase